MTTRRSLLVAAPALLTLGHAPGWARGLQSPFTLGVAAGDPAPDGFVIWTRLAPDPLAPDGLGGLAQPTPVLWEVAEDEGMRGMVARGRAAADARLAHTVHVEVAGLRPGRPYWYRFTALGAQSPVGRALTAPAPGAAPERLRLGVASCSHYEVGYFSAYRHLAAEAPDLTLFLGDYIYDNSYDPARRRDLVRSHGAGDAKTLAAYRRRYALYRTDADLQALHAAAPCLATWDDHEVEVDYAGDLPGNVGVGPEQFRLQRAAAYQAFYEHMPLRRRGVRDFGRLRIFHELRWGRLAAIEMLDVRQYRGPPACLPPTTRRGRVVDPACPERSDPSRSMLGTAQEAWLHERFRRSDAHWNLVGQGLIAASVLQKGPDGGPGVWTDSWDGYPATRDRMLAPMQAARLSNPVILSGDIHAFFANEVKAKPHDPESRAVAAEFVATSVSADPPAPGPFLTVRQDNPHVRHYDAAWRGYISMEIGERRAEVRFRAISDRTDPNAGVATLARFALEHGRSEVQPA